MNIDIIGKIGDTPATFNDEGEQLTPATFKDGFHVNFTEPVTGIEGFLVEPQPVTPARVYSGVLPICYKFPDEDTFRTYFPEPVGDDYE